VADGTIEYLIKLNAGQATSDLNALGAAAARSQAPMGDLTSAAKLSGTQIQQLGFQINDMATMAAMGANPMQILASQGGQIAQVAFKLSRFGQNRMIICVRADFHPLFFKFAYITPIHIDFSNRIHEFGNYEKSSRHIIFFQNRQGSQNVIFKPVIKINNGRFFKM